MKHLLTILLTTLTITSIQAQNYRWAHGFGTPTGDSHGTSIATDAQGNVYATGFFADSIDFDPTPGTAYVASNIPGQQAMYVAKYDSAGIYQWAFGIDGYYYLGDPHIAVNATGVYVTGCFVNTTDFDPFASVANLTAVGYTDIFLAKYDLNGNYQWAINMGGVNIDVANAIAIDNVGNSYITGYFKDTADFDPGISIFNLISDTLQDTFFAKYDMGGNLVWAHDLCDANGGRSGGGKIMSDNNSNTIYITGSFSGTIDFDRGGGIFNVTDTNQVSTYIAKYDTSGSFIWAGSLNSTMGMGIVDIHVNNQASNDFYICGSFWGVADFDLFSGVFNVNPNNNNLNIYFAKYSLSGNLVWVKQINSTNGNLGFGRSITTDSNGDVYLTGVYMGTTDFDASTGISNLISTGGSRDIFFAKYDSSGDFRWARGIGGVHIDQPNSIALDNAGSIYLTGFFTNTMDADPGAGVATLFPATGENIFIAKYDNSLTNIHSFSSQNNSSNLLVYPNPASSYITLGANLHFQKFNYSICDLSGRMVLTRKDAMNKTLNISMLSPGAYIINIQTTKQNLYGEFIKLL